MNDGPLSGCGVLITRPQHQARALTDAVRAAGGIPLSFPVLAIVGRDPAAAAAAVAAAPNPDIVIFISANAVAFGLDLVRNTDARLAAIGPATRRAIEAAGASVALIPDGVYDSEHLLAHPNLQAVAGLNIHILRGQDGRELLADTLSARGATVTCLSVYDRVACEPDQDALDTLAADLNAGRVHFVVAMSGETIEQLVKLLPASSLLLLRQSTLVAPSSRVIKTASQLLPGIPTLLAPGPQATAIVDALGRHRQNGPQA